MSDNQVDTEKYDKLSCEQNTKLQKRISELRRYQSREAKCYEQSTSEFIGYVIAGLVLWFVMRQAFEMACWPESKFDADPNYIGTKGLWNVAMYVVPFCFWGLAIRHFVISVISWVEYSFAHLKIIRLKKKLAK
ncbi:hypothetical protein AB6F89_22030 [Providencia hangzhouensis]|uniref:hypothetical protein n=1 Tax=Providencia hangzhouensis TaxID=3031799 RepID=UPI001D267CB7|nr:hypothetical protein [Providencia rettgeri]EIJ7168008.1 hypothetical protein [Providencia rettgeri]EMA4783749.1 hypothetical protein [Providencia rettgeri]